MKKSKKILLKWAATYGEDESDVKASMYNEDMMIEFAKYYHKQKLTLTDVVSSFITADDEGKHFVVNTDLDDDIEKGSVVYLLRTYPEDIHLFQDKNGYEVWIYADDVDRKK